MTESNQTNSQRDPSRDAIATAIRMATDLSRILNDQMTDTTTHLRQTVGPQLYDFVERGTETVGRVITPIAENPLVRGATRVPVMRWMMAALGQVDGGKVQQKVDKLRLQYPLESSEQLANRVIAETAMQAAGIGLLTNFTPPMALSLLAVDVAAIAALQAEMVYHIAAIYGFPTSDAARRGEVLIIWGLSTGSSGLVKSGLSLVETVPFLGPAIGVTSNAAILYALGQVARLFYEEKRRLSRSSD